MEKHVTVLGILFIAYSAVGLATGLLAFLVLLGVGTVAELSPTYYCTVDALPILVTIGFFVLGILTFFSIPGIVAGIGLLKFQPWARILTLILSILYLLEVPFGTALGVYGLWVLFKQETVRLFSEIPPLRSATSPPRENSTSAQIKT